MNVVVVIAEERSARPAAAAPGVEEEDKDVDEDEDEDALCSMLARARSRSTVPEPPGALLAALAAAERVSMKMGTPLGAFGKLPKITGWMPSDLVCSTGRRTEESCGEGTRRGRRRRRRRRRDGCPSGQCFVG